MIAADAGLQAERTGLAWVRTAAASAVLAGAWLRIALPHYPWLATCLGTLGAALVLVLLVLSRKRLHAGTAAIAQAQAAAGRLGVLPVLISTLLALQGVAGVVIIVGQQGSTSV